MNAKLLGSLLLSWVFIFGMTQAGLIGPNRSSIEAEFGLSHAVFGLAIAVIQCVSACIMMLIARQLQRYKSLIVLSGGLCVQSLGYYAIMLSHSSLGLVGGWLMIMLGSTAGTVTNNLSMLLFTGNPRKGVMLLHSFNAIGKIAGPLLAAICLMLSWRSSFLVVGIITSALCVFVFCSQPYIGTIPRPATTRTHFDSRVVRRPFFWLSILPFGLIGGGEIAFAALMPTFYQETQGFTKSAASLLLTVHLLGLAAGRLVSVPLNQRVSNNAIIGGCLLAGLAVFPAVFLPHSMLLYPMLFLVGVMFSCIWPTFYAQASLFHQDYPDLFAYGTTFGNALGTAGCVYLSSLIADHNLRLSLLFCPGVLWLFGLIYFTTRLSHAPKPALREPRPSAVARQTTVAVK
ncbi:MAG TPA: MFS transporter [Armatimonadota bacterium]|nr:MFS transporter [Armatimonadota bacterium]